MTDKNPPLPSERSFGLLMAACLALLVGLGLWRGWHDVVVGVAAGFAVAFALAVVFASTVLKPLNRAWFKLGMLMGKVVSPIVLGAMFFLFITPVALVMRLFGRDELRLKARLASSYWIKRDERTVSGSFHNQF